MQHPTVPQRSHGEDAELTMRVAGVIVQMIAIITGLLLAVGALFYALAWIALAAVSYFPLIGKRHRHARWEELNKTSSRRNTR